MVTNRTRKSFGSRRKNYKSCSDWHRWRFSSAFKHFGTHFAESFRMSKSSWMMDPTRSREMSSCSAIDWFDWYWPGPNRATTDMTTCRIQVTWDATLLDSVGTVSLFYFQNGTGSDLTSSSIYEAVCLGKSQLGQETSNAPHILRLKMCKFTFMQFIHQQTGLLITTDIGIPSICSNSRFRISLATSNLIKKVKLFVSVLGCNITGDVQPH